MNTSSIKYLTFLFFLMVATACGQHRKETKDKTGPTRVPTTKKGYEKAYFSSGCFWCSESIYESVIGVTDVISGYAGGKGKNPTYQTYSQMGYAETIEVTYDPKVIDFKTLLTVYFSSQNVTQKNGQGPDRGTGYRSIIFYQDPAQKKVIKQKIAALQQKYDAPIAAEVKPFQKFWKAEDYHQNFDTKHPGNPYVQNVSIPRLNSFQKVHPELLKENN